MRWFAVCIVSMLLTAVVVGLQRACAWPRHNVFLTMLILGLLAAVLVSLVKSISTMRD